MHQSNPSALLAVFQVFADYFRVCLKASKKEVVECFHSILLFDSIFPQSYPTFTIFGSSARKGTRMGMDGIMTFICLRYSDKMEK